MSNMAVSASGSPKSSQLRMNHQPATSSATPPEMSPQRTMPHNVWDHSVRRRQPIYISVSATNPQSISPLSLLNRSRAGQYP